jgi:hypothetical protein
MGRVTFATLLAAAMAHQHDAPLRQGKPTLAVGAALDDHGRLWLAKVENQRLWIARSDDGGRPHPFPQRTFHAELRLDY